MKKLTSYFLIALVAISTVAFISTKNTALEPDMPTDDFIEFLAGAKSYTIELAELMPADKYTVRPHDSVRSFGEQMAHIGMSSKMLMDILIKGGPMPGPEEFAKGAQMEKEMGANKEQCIATITAAFKDIEETYKGMTDAQRKEKFKIPQAFDPNQPEFTNKRGFEFIKEHMIHHRGQALVSLRMQGIKAPAYRLY